MGFTSRLLGLTAKIGLDLLIGSTRTDEAVALISEWLASRSPEERSCDVSEARNEAAHSDSVRSAVEQAAADAGMQLRGEQLEELSLSVLTGLEALYVDTAPDPTSLVERLIARRGTYAVWLDLPEFGGGPGHYCHFSWDDGAYRVRAFLGGRIYHTAGRRVSEPGLLSPARVMPPLGGRGSRRAFFSPRLGRSLALPARREPHPGAVN